MRLWIDDERPAPEWASHHAKTSAEAISMLADAYVAGEPIEHVAFDHDLGAALGVAQDVRPVIYWMHDHRVYPETASIHTANPWGRKWLTAELQHETKLVETPR